MTEYSILPYTPELETHHRMQFSVVFRRLIGAGILPLCRYSTTPANWADSQKSYYHEIYTFFWRELKVKLATVVQGNPKAPFYIATTPKCWEDRCSIPWFAPLYLWSAPYNTECFQIPFLCLWYYSTWHWIPVCRTIGKHSTH